MLCLPYIYIYNIYIAILNRVKSYGQEGRSAVGLDICIDQKFDILTTEGFLQHLYQVCKLQPGTGFLAAPVCSSFVFMNLG